MSTPEGSTPDAPNSARSRDGVLHLGELLGLDQHHAAGVLGKSLDRRLREPQTFCERHHDLARSSGRRCSDSAPTSTDS
jgi:hypothetical protein